MTKSDHSEVHGVGAAAGGEVAEGGRHVVHLTLIILHPSINSRASNEGSRRFYNHGEGPY